MNLTLPPPSHTRSDEQEQVQQLSFLPPPPSDCPLPTRTKPARRTLDDVVAQMRRIGQRIPHQYKAHLRERRATSRVDVKRRKHDRGQVARRRYSEQAVIALHVVLFMESIGDLHHPATTVCDQAEIWAWIDRGNPREPFSFQTCLEFFCIEAGVEPDWVRQGIEQHRPAWLARASLQPAAFGLYVLARYLD
jgi:hypothetical protein